MLAKLLLAAPDVMLLDEPSNHLDIDTTRWLEDYLVQQPEAMLIVSHDRYFLDRVVTKVFELHAQPDHGVPRQLQAVLAAAAGALRAGAEGVGVAEGVHREAGGVHPPRPLRPAAQAGGVAAEAARQASSGVERPTLVEAPRMHFGEVRRSGDVVLARRGPEQGATTGRCSRT